MTVRVLVFANCQANPIASLIGIMSPEVEIVRCPAVHTIAKERADEILELIRGVDMVVHQPIGDNFGPLAVSKIKELFPEKRYCSFPSIYFGSLFPQLGALRQADGSFFHGPLKAYHDNRVLNAYLQGRSRAECVAAIENDAETYDQLFDSALEEATRREQETDIKLIPYILESLKERPCFYTFNHPDNALLFEVASRATDLLGLERKPDARAPMRIFLGDVSAAIPDGIAARLNVEWRRNFYLVDGHQFEWDDLVNQFYDLYAATDGFVELVERNRGRITAYL